MDRIEMLLRDAIRTQNPVGNFHSYNPYNIMKILGFMARWHEHGKIYLRILVEGQGDGNDSPQVHKTHGWWLDSVGIKIGALALFLLVNECGMYHLWGMTSRAQLQGGHYFHG